MKLCQPFSLRTDPSSDDAIPMPTPMAVFNTVCPKDAPLARAIPAFSAASTIPRVKHSAPLDPMQTAKDNPSSISVIGLLKVFLKKSPISSQKNPVGSVYRNGLLPA